ncbi:MAG TPA: hypothetical protein VEQ66_03710 [Propionibacteriaceae bacterium]|nr:hypothetical protein [Propionibacteriaceae bacterium]
MDIATDQPPPAFTGGRSPAPATAFSARAGAVTVAQLAAAVGYVACIAFGEAPEPFSFGDWTFILLPPALFAFLFVVGLFGLSSARLVAWQRVLSGLGSLVAGCGLALSLVLLPLGLAGSFMDYTVG